MKLSPSVRGSIRQFALWVANRSVGHPLLEGIDITAIFEEPSATEAAFAVFCNVLEMDDTGQVTNFKQAERRAAERIRSYCDPTFQPDAPCEDWEVDLHSVSPDRWNG